jgi:hypothetical protein
MKNVVERRLTIIAILFIFTSNILAQSSESELTVRLKGSKADGVYSHFQILVNDVVCGQDYASMKFKDYRFTAPFNLSEINDVKIKFDNDHYSIGEDRNLCVLSLFINDEVPILATTENVQYICMNGKEFPYCGMMLWNGTLVFNVDQLKFQKGDVLLSSQQEINNFDRQYVEGDLVISGQDVTDLSPLAGLTSLQGSLIIKNNPNLVEIDGLNSLIQLNFLSIRDNPKLTSIKGLNSIKKCSGMDIFGNDRLNTVKCMHVPEI